jgi:ABC-type lipoprotein export system ATPase subunit
MRFEKIRTFIKSLDMRSKASSKEINAKNFYGKDDSDIPGYTSDHIIFCDGLVKIYKSKDTEVVALQGLELEIKKGEMMAIIGNSGSGKSTLMNLVGGLDSPSAGTLIVDGKNLLRMKKPELLRYKKEKVGFVWQNNARNLIPYLPAIHNVEIPMILAGRKDAKKRAAELLEIMGLKERMNNRLSQLSGGEQQRVAIAIAMANNPKILLADEPTGAVDTATATIIYNIFRKLNKEYGITIIIVTHDRAVAKNVDRVVTIVDGRTGSEYIRKNSYKEQIMELDRMSGVEESETHEEMIVVDRQGRLKIPEEYLELAKIPNNSKVRLKMKDDTIVIYSKDKDDEED